MAKRERHAAHELVEIKYVDRYARKGWLDRDFCIGSRWYSWRKNIATDRGVYRFGVRDWTGSIEASLERS